MKGPPDLAFSMDKLKTLVNTSMGPKYLVMKRINHESNLANVSPFLIKKVVDNIVGGEVDVCKKLRDGTILIRTKTCSQAASLIKLTSLMPSIQVDVSEHQSLNSSKGVIYCNDLRGISEEDIQEELATQEVCEVHKILKKVNGNLEETGLIIIKFNTPNLPNDISIGYEKIKVRPYIPLPLKCRNCYRFGHTQKNCSSDKLCFNCCEKHHLMDDESICAVPANCINCNTLNLPHNHQPNDKSCPTFLKEKEVQAIITLEKTDRRTAYSLYNERHHNSKTFSSVVQIPAVKSQNFTKSISNNSKPTTAQRQVVEYSDLSSTAINPLPSASTGTIRKPIKLLPLKTSKRTRQSMKKIEKKSKISTIERKEKMGDEDPVSSSESMSI